MSSLPATSILQACRPSPVELTLKTLISQVDGAPVGQRPGWLEASEVSAFEAAAANNAANLYPEEKPLLPFLSQVTRDFRADEQVAAGTGNVRLPNIPADMPLNTIFSRVGREHPIGKLAARLAQTPPGQADTTGVLRYDELLRAKSDPLLNQNTVQELLGVYKRASSTRQILAPVPWAAQTAGVSAQLVRTGYLTYNYGTDRRNLEVGNRQLEVTVPAGHTAIVVTHGNSLRFTTERSQAVTTLSTSGSVYVSGTEQGIINHSRVDIYVINPNGVLPEVVDRISIELPKASVTTE